MKRPDWQRIGMSAIGATVIAFAFLVIAREARGDDQPLQLYRVPVPIGECRMPGILTGESLEFIREANQKSAQQIADLLRQIEELKKSKGCAKLEVTEPPRFRLPPLKKEHDS